MYALVIVAASSASSPNVPLIRPHLGSVAKSAMGDKVNLNPRALYSCLAMSPKLRTKLLSLVAANPNVEGQLEKKGL